MYSTILGQNYSFYFSRQGQIQDALFAEAFAVRGLGEACGEVARRKKSGDDLGPAARTMYDYADALRRMGFADVVSNDQDELRRLFTVLADVESAAGGGQLAILARTRYEAATAARCARASALASELPPIQLYAQVAISWILLAGFLLVDLGSPRFEAILFAILSTSFQLIESFVEDLRDPFGGAWTVDPAKAEVDELIAALAALDAELNRGAA